MLGVSVRTLQAWESGRRKPTGSARALLTVIAHDPRAYVDAATAPDLAPIGVKSDDTDERHAEAFRGLEGGIGDCTCMAGIAAQLVTNMAGLDGDLVFAVTHVFEMLTAFRTKYYAAWYDEGRPT